VLNRGIQISAAPGTRLLGTIGVNALPATQSLSLANFEIVAQPLAYYWKTILTINGSPGTVSLASCRLRVLNCLQVPPYMYCVSQDLVVVKGGNLVLTSCVLDAAMGAATIFAERASVTVSNGGSIRGVFGYYRRQRSLPSTAWWFWTGPRSTAALRPIQASSLAPQPPVPPARGCTSPVRCRSSAVPVRATLRSFPATAAQGWCMTVSCGSTAPRSRVELRSARGMPIPSGAPYLLGSYCEAWALTTPGANRCTPPAGSPW
jgi:hypothetical protein